MTRAISKYIGVSAFALATSCGVVDDSSTKIEVADNDLGITSLQTTQILTNGNDVFTLQAFSADARELASVKRTIGTISDLSSWTPGSDNLGSELLISVTGTDTRMVTRETERFDVPPPAFRDPATAHFLALATVVSTLEGANVFVASQPADSSESSYISKGPPPPPSQVYTVANCPASYMNITPVAGQCCFQSESQTGNQSNYWTGFVNPTTQATVSRWRNPTGPGNPCTKIDGVTGNCGAGCYYGPNGFSKPAMTVPPVGDPYGVTYSQVESCTGNPQLCGTACYTTHVASPPTTTFANVTGTYPTGQGCPGSDGGNGVVNGVSVWDY